MTAPYPSFLTAPGATGTFTIAAGSCAKYEDQPIFDAIEALDPALMLMMGDNHYGNTSDLPALRYAYRNSRKKSGVEKLFKKTPTIATWDDHDYTGNNATGSAPGKAQSLQGFKEAWANPSYGTASTPGVFHHAEWGGVDVIQLDDRYYRDLDGTMLGAEQHAWLLDTLKNSTAAFKLIVSGSQWTSFGSNDSWAAFNDEREEILQYIFDNDIGGVILLSGDIHRSEARELVAAGPGRYPIYELTSSGFAQVATPCIIALGDRLACYSEKNSFGLYTIDTTLADPTLKFEIRDIDGGVQYTLDVKLSDLQVQ
jgi:alkaline phosphatase D